MLGGSVAYAEPGDLVYKPRDVWHTFWNATDRTARLLEIISPAWFERLFVELDDLLKTDPDNVEAAAALGTKCRRPERSGRDRTRRRREWPDRAIGVGFALISQGARAAPIVVLSSEPQSCAHNPTGQEGPDVAAPDHAGVREVSLTRSPFGASACRKRS
jgi:hypothetical protein